MLKQHKNHITKEVIKIKKRFQKEEAQKNHFSQNMFVALQFEI